MRYAAHYQPTCLPKVHHQAPERLLSARSSPVRYRRAWAHPVGRKLHHNRWHRPRPRQPHNPCPPDQRGRHRRGPGPRLGYAASEVSTANGLDLLARPLSGGDVAVVLLNETATAASVITTSAVGARAASRRQRRYFAADPPRPGRGVTTPVRNRTGPASHPTLFGDRPPAHTRRSNPLTSR